MGKLTRGPLTRFIADQCVVNYEDNDEAAKQGVREIGARNMMIEQRLGSLLRKLQEKNIPTIVMKGCHLIQSVYPFGIRPVDDIDILIDRKHYADADEVVCSMGYKADVKTMDVWTHVEISNKITYINTTQPRIPIDVHFTLGPYPYLGRIPFEVLLQNSERMTANGFECLVLQPEMLMVHLILHLFQHHNEHWEVSAYDLCTLTKLQPHTIDWSKFIALIKRYSLSLPFQYSLKKAEQIAVIHIPASVVEEISLLTVTKREQRIFKASLTMINGMEKHVIQLLTLPSLKLKLLCLLRVVFPRRSMLRLRYHNSYFSYLADISRTAVRALLRARSSRSS